MDPSLFYHNMQAQVVLFAQVDFYLSISQILFHLLSLKNIYFLYILIIKSLFLQIHFRNKICLMYLPSFYDTMQTKVVQVVQIDFYRSITWFRFHYLGNKNEIFSYILIIKSFFYKYCGETTFDVCIHPHSIIILKQTLFWLLRSILICPLASFDSIC